MLPIHMPSLSSTEEICCIRQTHFILLPLQRKSSCLAVPMVSSQRKTTIHAVMHSPQGPHAAGTSFLSLTKEEKQIPVLPSRVDWLSLNDDEYEGSLDMISNNFGPDFSKMDEKEFVDFCKRRGKYVADCSDRLSELVGDVDLRTPWKESKSASKAIACNYGDGEELEARAVTESFDAADTDRAKQAMLSVGSGYHRVPGLPIFFWEQRHQEVFVPMQSVVAIDTSLLVYLAQRKVPEFERKGSFVRKLLDEPLTFVISQSTFVELMEVLLMESKVLPGVILRRRVIKPRWVAFFAKKMAVFGKFALQKVHLGELSSYVEKLGNVDGYLSKADARFNRNLRLQIIQELFDLLRSFTLAQSEAGRASYLNVFSLVSSVYIQPTDGNIVLECVGPSTHLFLTEDLQHGQCLSCTRDGVRRRVLVWHILKYKVKMY